MNTNRRKAAILQKLMLLVLLMAVPAFAGPQQKGDKPALASKASAPAQKPSAAPPATAPQHPSPGTGHKLDPNPTPGPKPSPSPSPTANPSPNPGPKPTSPPKTGPGPSASKQPEGREVTTSSGTTAQLGRGGEIRSLDTKSGMHIEHNLHGGRRIVSTTRSDARVVTTGKNSGYVQRRLADRGGHHFYSRTYSYHGVYRSVVYRSYTWHGHEYFAYYHLYWYHPAFYGWAYAPWSAPVAWGWGGAPWYGYYGTYFAPSPSYSSTPSGVELGSLKQTSFIIHCSGKRACCGS